MTKGKVTIEIEGQPPVILDFDEMTVEMSQSVFHFYDLGELAVKDAAPNGEVIINIVGVKTEVRKEFGSLCRKHHHVERVE